MFLVALQQVGWLCVLGLLPLTVLTNWKKADLRVLIWIIVYLIVGELLLILPSTGSWPRFIGGHWNWDGKIYSIIWSLLFIRYCPLLTAASCNLRWQQPPKTIHLSMIVLVVLTAIAVIGNLFGTKETFHWSSILYQATMPGLDEEIGYRGILMAFLVLMPLRVIRVKKITINPSVLITAWIFGLGHTIGITKAATVSFDWTNFYLPFFFGLLLAWLVTRTRSIVFPVIIHGVSDTAGVLVQMI